MSPVALSEHRLSGIRLSGFLADTVFQSDRRLRRFYGHAGLTLETTIASRPVLDQPVFIGHVVRK